MTSKQQWEKIKADPDRHAAVKAYGKAYGKAYQAKKRQEIKADPDRHAAIKALAAKRRRERREEDIAGVKAWQSKSLDNFIKNRVSGRIYKAKKKGVPCVSANEAIDALRPFPTHCPVFGIPLHYYSSGTGTASDHSASIDQIKPGCGYKPGNMRIVSARANMILNNATSEELRLAYEDRLRTEQLILQFANDLGPGE